MKHLYKLSLFAALALANAAATAVPPGHPPIPASNEASAAAETRRPVSPERAIEELKEHGAKISSEPARRIAVAQNGRIKPLDTLAREFNLFLTGSYSRWGLDPTQLYLALSSTESAPWAEVLEVRDTDLRKKLGYMPDKRFFSAAELESSNLSALAEPLLRRSESEGKPNEEEKKILEAFNQFNALAMAVSGEHFTRSVDFATLQHQGQEQGQQTATGPVFEKARGYLMALARDPREAQSLAPALVTASRTQPAPELLKHFLDKLDVEVFYNDARLFFWSSLIALFSGILFATDVLRKKLNRKIVIAMYAATLAPLIAGISLRVYITSFAPVTNMFGTMLWVSLGVLVFSLALFVLYGNWTVSAIAMIAAGLILTLTERIPLILSPDLDPLVAVLRSNFWLSTHVTTITISYAAFTVAMALGNVAIARAWTADQDPKFYREFSHFVYRMVQLGCFLLSCGIVLGGIWADYSWGRFWGWDPKETWALIADLGFIALMHARYAGWASDFTFLAMAPVAYLLVVMAWYGVNFILATGLHSYGFSSGGALMVATFVGAQTLFIAASMLRFRSRAARAAAAKDHRAA